MSQFSSGKRPTVHTIRIPKLITRWYMCFLQALKKNIDCVQNTVNLLQWLQNWWQMIKLTRFSNRWMITITKPRALNHIFSPHLVGVKCSQSLRTELSIPLHISSSYSGAGRIATSHVGFRLGVSIAVIEQCVSMTVILMSFPMGPVAEVVTAPWSPESPLAGETHLFALQWGCQHSAPDYPKCLTGLSLSTWHCSCCREGLAAAWL